MAVKYTTVETDRFRAAGSDGRLYEVVELTELIEGLSGPDGEEMPPRIGFRSYATLPDHLPVDVGCARLHIRGSVIRLSKIAE